MRTPGKGIWETGGVTTPARPAPFRRVRLQDVATAAGISLSQASAAISGASGVNPTTRDRVRAVAAELGYRPNEHALGLARATRNRFISVVVLGLDPDAEPPSHYLGALLNGILLSTAAAGLDVRMSPVGSGSSIAEQLVELPARDTADGYVLVPFVDVTADDLAPLERVGDPFVIVNRHPVGSESSVVTADFAEAAAIATEHLAGLGHERIALIGPSATSSIVRDYVDGWHEGARRSGLAATSSLFATYGATELRDPADALTAALGSGATATLCLNEIVAHRLLHDLAERGLRVPDDFSLVTFDDAVAPFTSPALTSVDLHLDRVGRAAVDSLAERLRGGAASPRRVAPTLNVRASTARAIH